MFLEIINRKHITVECYPDNEKYLQFEVYETANPENKIMIKTIRGKGTTGSCIDCLWSAINGAASSVACSNRYQLFFCIQEDIADGVKDELCRWRGFNGNIETFE
jgi:hypothetical protein